MWWKHVAEGFLAHAHRLKKRGRRFPGVSWRMRTRIKKSTHMGLQLVPPRETKKTHWNSLKSLFSPQPSRAGSNEYHHDTQHHQYVHPHGVRENPRMFIFQCNFGSELLVHDWPAGPHLKHPEARLWGRGIHYPGSRCEKSRISCKNEHSRIFLKKTWGVKLGTLSTVVAFIWPNSLWLGEKITSWIKPNAFWMSLGLGHVKPHMGRFFNPGAQSARKPPLPHFFDQFSVATIFWNLFSGAGRRRDIVWSIVLAQLKHARNRCNISFTWFCSIFSLGGFIMMTLKWTLLSN